MCRPLLESNIVEGDGFKTLWTNSSVPVLDECRLSIIYTDAHEGRSYTGRSYTYVLQGVRPFELKACGVFAYLNPSLE